MNVLIFVILLLALVSYAYFSKQEKEQFQTQPLNLYGKPLELCALFPATGADRQGKCIADSSKHVVCAIMTKEFLDYSSSIGNDLTTRRPGFWGLREGDRWCICKDRFLQAYQANPKYTPFIIPEATHIDLLQSITMKQLEPMLV